MKSSIVELLREGKSSVSYNDGDRMRLERWTVDDLMKLSPYYKNRPVDNRVKKKKSEMETFLPTHLEVKVGRVMIAFGPYKVGDLFTLDGNTRTALWRLYENLRPTVLLMVTIIDVIGEEECDRIYYSIDSLTSVEKSNEKIGGYYRSKGYVPVSKRVIEGRVINTVNDATKFVLYFGNKPNKEATIYDKMDYVWKEFVLTDCTNLDPIKNMSSNLHCCLIMIVRKYGIDNIRVQRMFECLKYSTYDINEKDYCDGVHYVMVGLLTDNKDKWTSHTKSPELLHEMLFALDSYVNNVPLKKKKNYVVSKNQRHREFFQLYMD